MWPFKKNTSRLRSDTHTGWSGRPRKRKRVHLTRSKTTNTENFLQHAVSNKQSATKLKWITAFIITLTVLGSLLYAVFFSGYFTVRNILVVNTSEIPTLSEEEIRRHLISVQNRNIFLVHTADVISDILDRNLRIRFIQAERILPDSLRITIEEYPVVAHLWQGETDDNALVNEAGFIVARINNPEDYGQYITIKMFNNVIWKEDMRAIERDDLIYMISLSTIFENQFGVDVKRLDYFEQRREVHLVTAQGWEIWFDFNRSVQESVADLILVFEEATIADEQFSSIDLRIPGKVYVCRNRGTCIPSIPVESPRPFYSLPEELTIEN